MSKPGADLQHRDWLLRITIKQVLAIDPTITYRIDTGSDNSKHLILSDISEESLPHLAFITNTDCNNNYLYLEALNVSLVGNNHYLQIPGLNNLSVELWNHSDSNAFTKGDKFFKPFDSNLKHPLTENPMNIIEWIDIYSSVLTFLPNTRDKKKKFRLILNPDCAQWAPPSLDNPCCPGYFDGGNGCYPV